ncbi:MAG: SLBB domain-containing protein [Sedimentisphaerales bacterium]|nr:SLBB domain-containing protein [Sedimentisphaerales bacterium]
MCEYHDMTARGMVVGGLFLVILAGVPGCGPRISSEQQLLAFNQAGPLKPQVDMNRLVRARIPSDIYCAVPGDVLDLQMPVSLRSDEAVMVESLYQIQSYPVRVSEAGTIHLPMVGEIPAAGRDLAQIEKAIEEAYYPKYVRERPSVIAKVIEYHTQTVSIVGAVKTPGTYALQSNEMSLVTLLMKAGGIVEDGAGAILIRPGDPLESNRALLLPVKGFNILFADVALQKGDVVEVEQLDPQVFTVIGLANRPGTFAYPPLVKYSLLEALGFAGGINEVADPRYVKVYRQGPDGRIVEATFKIVGRQIHDAALVTIHPGDVISVERTLRTDVRMVLSQLFRIYFSLGGSVRLVGD